MENIVVTAPMPRARVRTAKAANAFSRARARTACFTFRYYDSVPLGVAIVRVGKDAETQPRRIADRPELRRSGHGVGAESRLWKILAGVNARLLLPRLHLRNLNRLAVRLQIAGQFDGIARIRFQIGHVLIGNLIDLTLAHKDVFHAAFDTR